MRKRVSVLLTREEAEKFLAYLKAKKTYRQMCVNTGADGNHTYVSADMTTSEIMRAEAFLATI